MSGLPVSLATVAEQPLALLGLALWVALLATLPRDRAGLLLLALAIGVRVATWSPRVHYHRDRAVKEVLAAAGLLSPDHAYGGGWTALMLWPSWLSGGHVDAVHVAQALLAALAVPHLYGALRQRVDARSAAAAAALLAVAPLPLALAPTETRYVGVLTLQVAAVHGLLRADRAGDVLLVLAGGVLAHLRPVEAALSLVLVPLALATGRRAAAASLLALVAWRVALWVAAPPALGGFVGEGLRVLPDRTLVGPEARLLVLDPHVTPVALPVLALAGAALAARRAPGLVALLAGLLVATTLAYAHQPYEMDRLRMQLPAQAWVAALAGLALGRVRAPAALAALVLLAAATWWPARQPVRPRPWQVEHALLREAATTLPPGAVVAYDATLDDQGEVRAWLRAGWGVTLAPLDEAGPEARWRWVGLADHVDAAPPAVGPPLLVRDVDTGDEDLWGCRRCERRTVTLGLHARGP